MAYELNRDGMPQVNTPIKDVFMQTEGLEDVLLPSYRWGGSRDPERVTEHVTLRLDRASAAQITTMAELAKSRNERRLAALLDACLAYRSKAPNFAASYFMMLRYLSETLRADGWIYKTTKDGQLLPYLIVNVRREEPDERSRRDGDRPYFTFSLACMTPSRERDGAGVERTSVTFESSDTIHKTPQDALERQGFQVETPELRAAYDAWHAYHAANVDGKFAEQFRMDRKDGEPGVKVILDTRNSALPEVSGRFDNSPVVLDPETGKPGRICPIPVHLFMQVFRLDNHRFERINTNRLVAYQYNPGLADKLILPESHTNILDVLTSDTAAYLGDIIEGKSSGNVILCMGSPGVGKTLTAEVYSEIVQRPLYNLHSGELGTSPASVEKEIQEVFRRVKRWNCVLLLDEADVFVRERGVDLNQNAVVAVFLRVLEYSEALMFMTTNLSEAIDDAIVSRCAAIIRYSNPTRDDRHAIWRVMAENNGVQIPAPMLAELVDMFPSASPRDVKHLLRLALRVAQGTGKPLTMDMFQMVGAFRNVEIAKVEPALQKPLAPPRIRKRFLAPAEE